MDILKIKNSDGSWASIPAITGPAGPQGEQGLPGEKGADGLLGADGKDGQPGANGKDATINGVNALNIVEGDNITLSQSGETLTISATGGGSETPIATTAIAGKVKPDGTSITVDPDGTIHGASGGGGGSGFDLSDRMSKGAGKGGVSMGTDHAANTVDGSYGLAIGYKVDTSNGLAIGNRINAYTNSIALGSTNFNYNSHSLYAGSIGGVGGNIAGGYDDGVFDKGIYAGIQGGSTGCLAFGKTRNGRMESEGVGCLALGNASYGDIKVNRGYGSIAFGEPKDAQNSIFVAGKGCFGGGDGIKVGTNSNTVASFGHGYKIKATSNFQMASGKNNIEDSANTYARIIGNGSYSGEADNAYTLDWKGNASFKGKVSSQGADYAEYFEWLDKNPAAEDRVGYIVTLEGNKIKLADAADDVLGIISGTVGVLGDNYEWNWQGKYLTDDFGRIQIDMVEEFTEHENEKGEIEKVSLGKFPHPRLNPAYNPDEEYINRANRPEWDAVGMMGKLYVRDDGTATVGGYVKPAHGIATHTDAKTNMRVMERIKDNIIRVVLK